MRTTEHLSSEEMIDRMKALGDRLAKNSRFALAQTLAIAVLTNACVFGATVAEVEAAEAKILRSLENWERHEKRTRKLKRVVHITRAMRK